MRIRFRALFVFFPLLPLLLPGSGRAQTSITFSEVRAGLDGYCKVNTWMPVSLIVENDGPATVGSVTVTVTRLNGTSVDYAKEVSLPTQSRKRVSVYAFADGALRSASLHLTFPPDAQRQELPVSCLARQDRLVGALADDPAAFLPLTRLHPPGGRAHLARLSLQDVPDQPQALGALDALVTSHVDTRALAPPQHRALVAWVTGGGQLLITGGAGAHLTTAGLEDLLPLVGLRSTRLAEASPLNALAPGARPLTGTVSITTGDPAADAAVLAREGGDPLLVTRAVGAGKVVYIAADPALAPLADWEGMAALYDHLLGPDGPSDPWIDGIANWDMATSAATTLPGLQLPSAVPICGFLLLYVLAIGPGNYLLLRRIKRTDLAWITMPTLVLLFSAIALTIGLRARGDRPVLNRLAVIQSWEGAQIGRLTGLVGVFSPDRDAHRLNLNDDLLAQPMSTGFAAAVPGWRFLESAAAHRSTELSVEAGTFRSLALSGYGEGPAVEHNLVFEAGSRTMQLRGEVINRSAYLLQNAVLLAPGNAQVMGNLSEAGGSAAIDLLLERAQPARGTRQPYAASPLGGSSIGEILGQDFFSVYDDPAAFRRYALLSAVIAPYEGEFPRGGGVYLVGWSETPALGVNLDGIHHTQDTTLHVMHLFPRLPQEGDLITLPPPAFEWVPLTDANRPFTGPYNPDLTGEGLAVRFRPAHTLAARSVESLTLHLRGGAAGTNLPYPIALWDFPEGNWTSLEGLTWGDNEIGQPERFVDPAGEVRLQIQSADRLTGAPLRSADLTLQVHSGSLTP